MAFSAIDFFMWMESYGLTDSIIPFFLIFLIIYAVLNKTHILGDRKNFNVTLAILLGLMVVIPHIMGRYPHGSDVVDIMNAAIPNVSLVVVAVVMTLLLIGVFGVEFKWIAGSTTGIVTLLAIAAVVYFFGAAAGLWRNLHADWFSEDLVSLIVAILVFGIIVAFITKEKTEGERVGTVNKALRDLSGVFGGKGGH